MNKLFVRLVGSGAIAASMGATALASSASIDTTGPGSTNVITSSSHNLHSDNLRNRVDSGNWNYQTAKTGNDWSRGNGGGGNGNREASIFLTGPGSNNQISGLNRNEFRSSTNNNVRA